MTAAEKKFLNKYIVNIAVPANCIISLLKNLNREELAQAVPQLIAVLLGLAATLLLFCAAAGANGYDLWGILARWTDEQLAIEPDQIVPIPKSDIHIPEEPEEYSSLQEALSACGLSQPLAPSWMPEGFELSALHVEDMSELGNVMFAALYARDDSHLTIFINVYFDTGQYSTSPSTHFQKDEGDPVPYTVGGETIMLLTTAGRPAAVWASGPAVCSVTGDITTQELKQIIDSIYCGQ